MGIIKHIFFSVILCGAFMAANAQLSYMQRGDKYFKEFRYDLAAEEYEKAALRDTNDIDAWEKLGNVYMITEDYVKAEKVYHILSQHFLSKPVHRFYYAQVLRRNAKYAEAQVAYTDFAREMPLDWRAHEFKNFFNTIQPFLQDYQLYLLSPVAINSEASEIGPAYLDKHFVFSSDRTGNAVIRHTDQYSGKGYYDLYQSEISDSGKNIKTKKLRGEVNLRFNEGPATFTKDGKEMYFTRSNYVKVGTDLIHRLGIYYSRYDEKKGWIDAAPLPFNSLTYNVAHPSLSRDGKRLYFISDMPGSLGETDVYVSEKKDNEWQSPFNLGPTVNTPGREMFPYIDGDGVLFFSSDTRVGLGGLDIFSAYNSDSTWKYVTNLGAPLNTNYDDFGYVSNRMGNEGYIVSNRSGGAGEDDIYHFVKNEKSFLALPPVFFDSSSIDLTANAMQRLDTVAQILQASPQLIIELGGNTDARGNEVFNLALSIRRANACFNYLVEKGIARDRLFIAGYGEDKIANKCIDGVECTYEEHAYNRRTDFKIIRLF